MTALEFWLAALATSSTLLLIMLLLIIVGLFRAIDKLRVERDIIKPDAEVLARDIFAFLIFERMDLPDEVMRQGFLNRLVKEIEQSMDAQVTRAIATLGDWGNNSGKR